MLFTGEHRNHAPENLDVALSSFAQEETYNLEEEDDHYNQSNVKMLVVVVNAARV